jgi:sugar phosphate isomerase/epimerase
MSFRYAICNEVFQGWPIERVIPFVREVGYQGLEIAPFTLAEDATTLTADRRREIARLAADAGLEIIGLHWLLVSPKGLHITTPDAAVRRRTTEFLRGLVDLCADLGGTVMVFGSPGARNLPEGMPYAEGWRHAGECFAGILDKLAERGVTLALEPLSGAETNIFRTTHEAWHMVRQLNHPRFKLHLDVKAMCAEGRPLPEIIAQHIPDAAHFHANDPNRRGPGFGDVDFVPIFAALRKVGYGGWVSVEPFDYSPDPETVARGSLGNMRRAAGA